MHKLWLSDCNLVSQKRIKLLYQKFCLFHSDLISKKVKLDDDEDDDDI